MIFEKGHLADLAVVVDLSVVVSAHHINDGVEKNLSTRGLSSQRQTKTNINYKDRHKFKHNNKNLEEGDYEDKDEPDVDHLDVGGFGEALGHGDEHRD